MHVGLLMARCASARQNCLSCGASEDCTSSCTLNVACPLLEAFSNAHRSVDEMQATARLRDACADDMPGHTEIHAPASGEAIHLGLSASAHQLQLSARLLQSIILHSPSDQKLDAKHRPFKVAWIDGKVHISSSQVSALTHNRLEVM